MRIVDLTHPWGIHTPGWVGYPGGKLYYTQNLQTNQIVSQKIETSLHSGTHLDGPMHGTDGGLDMASLPLDKLIHTGVIVDVSDSCTDWDFIEPEHITSKIEVRKGDIIIIHTGFIDYYQGMPKQDLVRYFTMHPGGSARLAEWMADMEIRWWGIDAGSGDHPMNTTSATCDPTCWSSSRSTSGCPIGISSAPTPIPTTSPGGRSPPISSRCTTWRSKTAASTPRTSAGT
jgi:kynurenine formamidase